MSRRALLWLMAVASLVFAFFAAVNVSGTLGGVVSVCGGFGYLDDWFGNPCSPFLPERLAWLTVGVAAFIVFGYFAEKNRPPVRFHDVTEDDDDGWVCNDCGFVFDDATAAAEHSLIRLRQGTSGSPEERRVAFGSRSVAEPAVSTRLRPDPPASEEPEFKTCPDCAEQVRFAARKCRFCGHQFTDVPV